MKTKKITFNMIAVGKEMNHETELHITDEITVMVKNTLDIRGSFEFVSYIVNICFDVEDGEYTPEAFDFSVKVAMLVKYAGIDEPKDLQKAYDVIYNTDLYDRVHELIDVRQFAMLVECAKKRIEHLCRVAETAASQRVTELISKMDSFVKDSNDTMEAMNSSDFKKFVEQIAENAKTENAEDASIPVLPDFKKVDMDG